MNETDRLKLDVLSRQWDRIRSLQQDCFRRIFSLGLLSVGMILLAGWNLEWLAITLPFLLITTGVQASFHLHMVDFARIYAEAMEQRMNALLGEQLHVGSRLEEVYFHTVQKPRIGGFSFAKPASFFSFFTLHYSVLWLGAIVAAGFIAYRHLGPAFLPWLLLVLAWLLLNLGFLSWYFITGKDRLRMQGVLHETLGDWRP